MNFQSGKIIKDHRNENRWKVIGVIQRKKFYTVLKVEDQAPELKRNLYLIVLNYDRLPGKNLQFEISDLRHSFHQMAEILCMNYTFLPEPVDLINFTNNEDSMNDALRDNDPGLIFAQPEGFQLPKQTKTGSEQVWQKVKNTVRSCSKTLSELHRNRVVIRSLSLYSIILSHTTFKPYFFGFDTLIKMNDFKGYNPGKVCLEPEAVYSAPECFDARGYLSPATDIYVLGKLVLQIILPEQKFKKFFPVNDPFPADIQNRINNLNIPPMWSRFLSLSLNPSPDLRFQNTYEVEQFFLSKGQPSKKPDTKPPVYRRKYWKYSPNSQLPSAALVIWGNWLTKRGQQFDYKSLYRKFQYKYSYEPRLFFNYSPKPIDETLPFFKMLKETYGLTIVRLESTNPSEQTKILFNHLIPENLKNLIIVADSQQRPVHELFRHPKADKWDITWIRGGERQAQIPVNNLLDTSLFIRQK